MGKFANELEGEAAGVSLGLAPVEVEGSDGFAAFGKPVPMYRRAAAMEHIKAMYHGAEIDKEKAFRCIERMSHFIEQDNPHAAMESALGPSWGGPPDGLLDVTGIYRLLAVLLTAPKPRIRVKAK